MKNYNFLNASAICFPLLFLAICPVMAQRTLEGLNKAGARKLEADEVRTLLVEHTFIRGNRPSQSLDVTLSPDGTLSGRSANGLGSSGVIGTWTIDGDGRMCAIYRFTDGRIPASDWCGYHYAVGPRYFVVPGEQVQSAPRFRVWIKGLDDLEEPVPEK